MLLSSRSAFGSAGAVRAGDGAVGAGARERTAALIENVKSGKMDQLPGPVASALAGFPVDSHTRFNVDFGPLLRLMSDVVPDMPDEARSLLANPPAGLGQGSGRLGGRQGRCAALGVRVAV